MKKKDSDNCSQCQVETPDTIKKENYKEKDSDNSEPRRYFHFG